MPTIPPIPGIDDFAGPSFHTAQWDHDVDLKGKRVAIVGTGCSTIQVAPAIQPDVAQLDIYQRSPGWTIPKMDHDYPEWAKKLFRRVPAVQWLDRMATFAFMDVGAAAMTSQRWMIAPFARGRPQADREGDRRPGPARKVTPEDEIGCKRIMLTDAWYPTLTKPNVDLVTDPSSGSRPRASDGRRASSARPTSSSSARASSRTPSSPRWRSPAAAARRSTRSGAACRRPTTA